MAYHFQVHDVSGHLPVIKRFSAGGYTGAETDFDALVRSLNAQEFKPSYKLRGEGVVAVAVDRTKLKTVAFIKRVEYKTHELHVKKPASLEHIGNVYGIPVWLEIEDQSEGHVKLARDHIIADVITPATRPRRKETPKSQVAERVTDVIREEMHKAAFGECNLPSTPMTFDEACEVLRHKLHLSTQHRSIESAQLYDAMRTVLAYVTK